MASKNVKHDTWLHVTGEDIPSNKPDITDKNLKIIDQVTLEYLMENILELSSEDTYNSNDKIDNVISTEYSQISSPAVKSISSSSSEKVGANETVINGSEWLWYWSSRPEINNFYNCNKSITSEPIEQPYQEPESSVNNDNVQSADYRNWLFSYLPIIYSHACTFILGAATMYFFLKRWLQITTSDVA